MAGPKQEGEIHLEPGDKVDVLNFPIVGFKPGEARRMRVVGKPKTRLVARVGNLELTETSIKLESDGPVQKQGE